MLDDCSHKYIYSTLFNIKGRKRDPSVSAFKSQCCYSQKSNLARMQVFVELDFGPKTFFEILTIIKKKRGVI